MNEKKLVVNGIIYKEIRIKSASIWSEKETSTIGLRIDPYEMTIEVRHLLGVMPQFESLFLALLGDSDVRKLIEEYQEKDRVKPYKIRETTGISGSRDIFMTLASEHGDFITTKSFKLCHISGYDKLNEGFGNEDSQMYVGDFVELVVFLGLTKDMEQTLLQDVTYLTPKTYHNLKGYDTTVSKIL